MHPPFRRTSRGAAPLLFASLCAVLGASALQVPVHAGTATRPAEAADEPLTSPNIVLVMTDDQNRNELRWMPKTRKLLGGHGVTFSNALSPAPLCCPARAMTLTGQYGQNNGVQHNDGPFGGFDALAGNDNTLATWLQAAGYQTALVGKYLNGYEDTNPPRQQGWTRWIPAIGNVYGYFDTAFLTDAGERVIQAGNVTPFIGRQTIELVREFSATEQPFFIWASHVSPHGAFAGSTTTGALRWDPPRPTKKHRHVLGDVRLPSLRKPSFNAPGERGAPYPAPLMSAGRIAGTKAEFTGRLRTLQDVDDAVENLVAALKDTGELNDTYIVLVSDNGHLLGEHRLTTKNVLYHEDMEIPLVVRVPGAAEDGMVSNLPVTIADLTPTILELAGAAPGRVMDGRSFAPVFLGQTMSWRNTQLIQTGSVREDGPMPGWDFRGVRTHRYTFMRRAVDGARFLFDRRRDPYELVNLARVPAYRPILRELHRRHDLLVDCAGAACDRTFPALPAPD